MNVWELIDKYIEDNAVELADEIWNGNDPYLYVFHRAETEKYDEEYDISTTDEPTEDGDDWELIEEVDTEYIKDYDDVDEILKDWKEYIKDPYAYYGVRRSDFF